MALLRGYTVSGTWKECSNGKYTFGTKGGKEYFIKAFRAPKYPVEGKVPPQTAERMIAVCKQWERTQNKLLASLKKLAGVGGNLVVPVEIFRSGNEYCKVTLKIKMDSLSLSDIAKLPDEQKILLLKTMSHSLRTLHKAGIVHGDLKPDNILISRSGAGALTTKITDFDDSYFEGYPPSPEETVGTESYYSPELAEYICEEDKSRGGSVRCKSDIFAMGLIFHEYLVGEKPGFDGYHYAWESVAKGCPLIISPRLTPSMYYLVQQMLSQDPRDRPTIADTFDQLKKITSATTSTSTRRSAPPKPASRPTPPPPSASASDVVCSAVNLGNGQYKIIYTSGKSQIVPRFFVKSKYPDLL